MFPFSSLSLTMSVCLKMWSRKLSYSGPSASKKKNIRSISDVTQAGSRRSFSA